LSKNGFKKKKLLFVCESITAAHTMRVIALINTLDPKGYEIHLALGPAYPEYHKTIPSYVYRHSLESSVKPEVFMTSLAKGTLPYTPAVVETQVTEDLKLIKNVEPDLIIGDYRNSLIISAKKLKVPYLNITNITWHPQAQLKFQIPDLAIVRTLGEKMVRPIAKLVSFVKLKTLFHPYKIVAKKYGFTLKGNLNDLYVSGDFVFYADLKQIVSTPSLPANHVVGGPILTSVASKENIETDLIGPYVIVALGSSGPQILLPKIIAALKKLGLNAMISTSGYPIEITSNDQIIVTDFLPLSSVLSKATLLICNGGSPTAYMGLSKGVPVISIPSNLDQFNFSQALLNRNAGLRLRIEEVKEESMVATIQEILTQPRFKKSAEILRSEIAESDYAKEFTKLIEKILS
jgi:UDP:flavonoid glycosyltransferase YjiC (YdhE family)